VVVLLGHDVSDGHLAELASDGVSYIVAAEAKLDLAGMVDALGRELGIRRLLLEGGAAINGSFFAAGLVDELSLLVARILTRAEPLPESNRCEQQLSSDPRHPRRKVRSPPKD
jgi:riboflavin biosynthesis pyrimidine reductase